MLSTDSLVREHFLVCQLEIGYQLTKNQLAKNQLASNRPIGNWCQLASNWPIGLDWQLADRARFFWIGLAIGWPTKNYLSNWATLDLYICGYVFFTRKKKVDGLVKFLG